MTEQPRAAYIVTLSHAQYPGPDHRVPAEELDLAETLVLVPADTRSEAHRKAQEVVRSRQGWLRPRIIESLRLPGEAGEATRLFTNIASKHLQPAATPVPVGEETDHG